MSTFEASVPEEIPEDTPGYLNSEVFNRGVEDEKESDESGVEPAGEMVLPGAVVGGVAGFGGETADGLEAGAELG